jgi:mannose/cellobiose epimerase-like protein (N-acyl-D-glucosamine 2-epimerase family)
MPDDQAELTSWIRSNLVRQFDFGRESVLPGGGFGWMLDDGSLDASQPQFTWLTSRLVHVYSLAAKLGVPGAKELATAGFAGLTDALQDPVNGGWFSSVGPGEQLDSSKACYAQAHVVVAAASATDIGIDDALGVLEEGLAVLDEHFWDESSGMFGESFARDWSSPAGHRSATANMHGVEAMLAASAVLPAARRSALLDRALRIMERLVHREAASNGWRMPQQFTPDWTPDLEFNHATPADPFAPYGETIGLGFEWARLAIGVRDALGASAPGWLLDCAREIHARAAADGWGADGHPGFVYTTDWQGAPIIDLRLHWVHAEAVSSAVTLGSVTGDTNYAEQFATWWDYIRSVVVDPVNGSWRHELDPQGQPSSQIWQGRPDLYHSVHAALLSIGTRAATPLEVSRQTVLTER